MYANNNIWFDCVVLFQNYYLKKGENVAAVASDTGRLKDLMNEIQEKNLNIKCMSEQLREYEERVFTKVGQDQCVLHFAHLL